MAAGVPSLGSSFEGSLNARYPVPELEKGVLKQLKSPRSQIRKIEKDVNQVIKLCIEKQALLNEDYENLLQGKDGLSAKDLTKIAQDLRLKEEELRFLERDLALYTKDKKSSNIGLKILRTRLKLRTVTAKQEMLTKLKSGDSVIPEAFTLRAELNTRLEKITKSRNGSVIANEFAQALETYLEILHLTQKPGISAEHKDLINRELKVLRLKMRALAKTSLEVSKKDIKLLESLPHAKRISNSDAKRGQEVLLKLALAEYCFPSVSSANISPPDSRTEIVRRFMTGFAINPERPLTHHLLTPNVDILRQLSEALEPYGKQKLHFSLEGDEALPRMPVEIPLVFDQKVTSREKEWTKISTGGIFGIGGTKHPQVKEVAKKVEYLGRQCILAMKYLDDQAIKASTGEVRNAKEFGQGIDDLERRVDDIEKQLDSLRSVVATYGYDKVGSKIEKVIARQTNVLSGIRSKKGQLQSVVQDNYIEAVKGYKQALSCVQEARKNKSEAGRLMFEAQTSVEKIRANPGLADPNSSIVVKDEIGLMIHKAEAAINAARADGIMVLSKDEVKLRERILKSYLAKDFPKLKVEKDEAVLRSLLAKEMTNALFFTPQDKRDAKVVQILSLINLLGKDAQGTIILKNALTAPGVQDIYSRFNQDMTSPELIKGVSSRNNLRTLLIKVAYVVQEHSKEKDVVGKDIFQAMEHLREIEDAIHACDDVHQKTILGRMHEDAARLLDQNGKPYLEFTSDKTRMFAEMLNGKFTSKHNIRRIDAMLSKAITRYLYFSAPSEKRARGDEIATVIANIRAMRPEWYSELMADAGLKKIVDKFLVQMNPRRIEFESLAMEVNKNLALAKADKKNAVFHMYNAIEAHRKAVVAAAQMEDAGAVVKCRQMLEGIVSKAKYLQRSGSENSLVEKLSDETYRGKANILDVRRVLAKIVVLTFIDTQARRDENFQDEIGKMMKNIQAAQPALHQELINDPTLQAIMKTYQDEKILVSASSKSFAALEDFIRFGKQLAGATEKTSKQQVDQWKKSLADKEGEFATVVGQISSLTNIRPGSEAQTALIANLEALKLLLAHHDRAERLEIANEWYELNKPMQFIFQGVVSTYTELFAGDPIFLEPINANRIVVGHQIMAKRDPENKDAIDALVNVVKEFSDSITQVSPILGKPGSYEGSAGKDTLKLVDNITMTPERKQAILKLRTDVAKIREAASQIEFSTSEIGKIAEISKQSLLDNLEKTERQLTVFENAILSAQASKAP